eukprot:CCRYP_011080-RA/>CCRYP_011080-RA protein AED:0.25 eAED:0.25 QI:192/0.8/0.66/1/0.8/0.66/6/0/816
MDQASDASNMAERLSPTTPVNRTLLSVGRNISSGLDEAVDHITDQVFNMPLSSSPPTPVISAESSQGRGSIHNELGPPTSSPVSSPGLRNRKSASSADSGHLSLSKNLTSVFDDEKDYTESMKEDDNNDSERSLTSIDTLPNTNTTSQCQYLNEQQQQQQATNQPPTQQSQDRVLLQSFWRTYDDVIILSLFSIFGIVFRIFSATWFRMELGVVFSEDSALGTNLPLNCCSCFLLGLLCSGREAIGIVYSKALGGSNPYGDGRGIFDIGFGAYRGIVDVGRAGLNRARGYGNVDVAVQSTLATDETSGSNDGLDIEMPGSVLQTSSSGLHGRRSQPSPLAAPVVTAEASASQRRRIYQQTVSPAVSPVSHVSDGASIAGLLGLDEEFRTGTCNYSGEDELREVQLRALTRRIMASPSLVLFAARKTDIDVVEHYRGDRSSHMDHPARRSPILQPENHCEIGDLDHIDTNQQMPQIIHASVNHVFDGARHESNRPAQVGNAQQNSAANDPIVDGEIYELNIGSLRRLYGLNVGDGWDVGTSAEEMKHQILLGLRVGFCGAISTWSSWNSAMISLLRAGKIGEALVGYAIGIQLGVVCYRFGQQLAVYIFVYRRRREAKRDETRGYGLRLQMESNDSTDEEHDTDGDPSDRATKLPSVRVVVTVLFAAVIISLCCSIFLLPQHQQFAISLIFTPFGCLARWKLQNTYNKRLPGFPLGTFACNLLSCALSGSIGSFLAGNPGPEERIVLTSMIGKQLLMASFLYSTNQSSLKSSGQLEVLALIDPIIFKFDGFAYAIITVLWGTIIGFFSSEKNWADVI